LYHKLIDMANAFLHRNQAIQLTVFLLRVTSGIMFMEAGGMKLFGWFGGMPGGMKLELMSQVGIGAILEFFGGIAMILGLFTRVVAFLLAGEMAVAYWQFHAPNGAWPIQNHGEPAVLLCFIFLFFSAYGAGRLSIDALIWKREYAR
jgi:putative oxidoreductase